MNNTYTEKDVFNTLNSVNVNEHTEKKMNLTYLSWAWAWAEVKKRFPDANYTVYENEQGWNYFSDGRTCWVKVSTVIAGLEHVEQLPVMDFKNKSIPLDKVTSIDVNKSIKRCLAKCLALHGLGLYIFAGEDLPEAPADADAPNNPTPAPQGTPAPSDSSKESTTPKAESNPAPQKLPTPPAPVKENIPAPPPSAKVEAPKTTVKQAKKWTTVKSF